MTNTTELPQITRCRISHEMAFPIGYELLREHFGDLPCWSGARFYFSAHPTTFASEFAQILRSHEPYRILRLEHRTGGHVPSYIPAHWHFTLDPVPRDRKSVARTALCAGPFAALREFITRAPAHATYYNRIDAIFDPEEGICTTQLLWKV